MYSVSNAGWVYFGFLSVVALGIIIGLIVELRRPIRIISGQGTLEGVWWIVMRMLVVLVIGVLIGTSPPAQYYYGKWFGGLSEYAGTLSEAPDPTKFTWETAPTGDTLKAPAQSKDAVLTFDLGNVQKMDVVKSGTAVDLKVPSGTTSMLVHFQDTTEHKTSKAVMIKKKPTAPPPMPPATP